MPITNRPAKNRSSDRQDPGRPSKKTCFAAEAASRTSWEAAFSPSSRHPVNRCDRYTLELLRSLVNTQPFHAAATAVPPLSGGSRGNPRACRFAHHAICKSRSMDGIGCCRTSARGIAGGPVRHHDSPPADERCRLSGFLDMLLGAVARRSHLQAVTFRDLMRS